MERIDNAQIRGALARLTPEQRQVIRIEISEGWENESVCAGARKPVGAIKALQHRALDALRRKLLPKKEDLYG